MGPFFRQLQSALLAAGHSVYRVCFNGGDRFYSSTANSCDFRRDSASWIDFFDKVLKQQRSTDLIVFGDCRPLHRQAIEHARGLGLRVYVFEEGYLRPGWITLEMEGVNGYSTLPSEPLLIRACDDAVSPLAAAIVEMPFLRRAAEDVMYTLATFLLSWWYRGYRTHKPWSPLAEYRAGARRFFGRAAQRQQAAAAVKSIIENRQRFFLFPLQLDSDAQIRVHSPFGRMRPAIETVIRSFGEYAPADLRLVISEHPLDQAVVDLKPVVMRYAKAKGLSDRIVFLQGGTPAELLEASEGLVSVNSTIGLAALEIGRPVAVLGRAIYRIRGLVYDGPLDQFWTNAMPPDTSLLQDFKRMLIGRTQLPGGYYGPAARRLAVAGAVTRLLADDASVDHDYGECLADERTVYIGQGAAYAK